MSGLAHKIIITVVIVSVLIGAGAMAWATTGQVSHDGMQRQVAMAEAYCGQVYGDSDVYSAAVVGGHGGLHCVANTDVENRDSRTGPHLHEIPQKYKQQALEAEREGRDLGWSVETAHKHGDKRAWWQFEQLQYMPQLLAISFALMLVVGGVAVMNRNGDLYP